MGHFRVRIIVGEGGRYFACLVTIQLIPLPLEGEFNLFD